MMPATVSWLMLSNRRYLMGRKVYLLVAIAAALGTLTGMSGTGPAVAQCRLAPTPDPRSTACDVIYPVTVAGLVYTGQGTPTPVAGARVEVTGFAGGCRGTSDTAGGVSLPNCPMAVPCDCLAVSVAAEGFHPWREDLGFSWSPRFSARLVPTTVPPSPTAGPAIRDVLHVPVALLGAPWRHRLAGQAQVGQRAPYSTGSGAVLGLD
jgi:hypothetical protein